MQSKVVLPLPLFQWFTNLHFTKMKTKLLFAVSLLLGLLMAFFGLDKLIHFRDAGADALPPAAMELIGYFDKSGWFWELVGAAELAGGILLIFPKTRALGALVLVPVFFGIVLFDATVNPSGLILVAVLVACLAWIIWENRERYLPMVR